MSNKPTWREMVWSVARFFKKSPTPEQIYDRLAAKYPRMKKVLAESKAARSCVRSAMSSLRADGLILDEAQRAELARHPKPWNLRNKMRRDLGLCVSCPLPAVRRKAVFHRDGDGMVSSSVVSLGRCKKHQESHAAACASRKRQLELH